MLFATSLQALRPWKSLVYLVYLWWESHRHFARREAVLRMQGRNGRVRLAKEATCSCPPPNRESAFSLFFLRRTWDRSPTDGEARRTEDERNAEGQERARRGRRRRRVRGERDTQCSACLCQGLALSGTYGNSFAYITVLTFLRWFLSIKWHCDWDRGNGEPLGLTDGGALFVGAEAAEVDSEDVSAFNVSFSTLSAILLDGWVYLDSSTCSWSWRSSALFLAYVLYIRLIGWWDHGDEALTGRLSFSYRTKRKWG